MQTMSVPECGEADKRNEEYFANYSTKKFFDILLQNESPLILDVGAHRGESVRFFKELYGNAQIFSFEPDEDNFAELQKVADSYGTSAIRLAVGDRSGIVTYYKQSISHLGGLLPINTESSDSLGYAAGASNKKVEVPLVTIDEFCDSRDIDIIDLLKIDVQGYEVGVLNGAKKMLSSTRCCTVEVSLYDFYSGFPSLGAVDQIMYANGLSMWDISKISKNPKNLRTDWVELVYYAGDKFSKN